MVVGIHATLERLRSSGSIKEARGNTQGTYLIASSPGGADLIGLAIHFASSMLNRCDALAEIGEKLESILAQCDWLPG